MTTLLVPGLEIAGLAAFFVLYLLARQLGAGLRDIGRAARQVPGGVAL